MKLVIAGSRDLNVTHEFMEAILFHFAKELSGPDGLDGHGAEVITGGCPSGPDSVAREIFDLGEYDNIKYREFSARWDLYDKAAGPIRNKQMAEYGDALVLIWDGKSKGSANMKAEMLALKKPIYEVIIKKHP